MRTRPTVHLLLATVAAMIGCRADQRQSAPQPDALVVERPAPDARFDDGQPQRPTVAVEVQPTPGSQELIGQRVRVSLRRDALGLAATSTPEPDANMIAGKQVVLSGTVERFGDGWLVLKGDAKRYWIAASGILLIEVDAR
jgi:hypothetical protein